MSNVPGVGGKQENPGEIPLVPMGNLEGHPVKNETSTAQPLHGYVPEQNVRDPGGDFKHRFALAKEKGFWTVLQLILSSIFPFIDPPALYRAPEANLEVALALNSYGQEGRNIEDPKVQKALQQIFPNTQALKDERSALKTPQDERSFLKRVEDSYKRVQEFNLGEVNYVDKQKTTVLSDLNQLRQEVAKEIVGNTVEKRSEQFDNIKQYPLEQDASVVFNFYKKLSSEINQLNQLDVKDMPALAEAKNAQMASLNTLQKEVQECFSQRLQQFEEKMQSQLPQDSLKKWATQARVPLAEGNTFAQNYQLVTITLDAQIADIDKQQQGDLAQNNLLKDEESRLRQEQSLIPATKKSLEADKEKLNTLPATLKQQIDTLKESIKTGDELQKKRDELVSNKKGVLSTLLFNKNDQQELERIEDQLKDIADMKSTLKGYEEAWNAISPELRNETKAQGMQRIKPELDKIEEQLKTLSLREKKIPEELKQNSQSQQELENSSDQRSAAKAPLEKLKSEMKTQIENSVRSLEKNNEFTKWIRLHFYKNAFAEYVRSKSTLAYQDFIFQFHEKAKDSFKQELPNLLKSTFGLETSAAKLQIEQVVNQLIILNKNMSEAKKLDILEFV